MEKRYNAVVGQSGGPTCAINATLAGVIRGAMNAEGINKIYGMKNGVEGFLNEELIELDGYFENKENLELLCMTPAAALGSCRLKLKEDEQLNKIFEIIEKYSIKYFFYIGGNDSMDSVEKLEKYKKEHPENNPLNTMFIGVPKTIDNDLQGTDHTPGFGSAAKFISCSMQEIARDCAVYRQKAVTIVEIMGRDAGWLTASSCLANVISNAGPDLIYLPEKPFSTEDFIDSLKALLAKPDKNSVIVAVSEGIRDKDGNYVAKAAMSGAVDIFGHAYLAGTGKYLENLVRSEIGCKCRSVELNVLQRCASHIASKTDIDESFMVGKAAVEVALEGKSGKFMLLVREEAEGYKTSVSYTDIELVANKVKNVPDSFITSDGKNVTEACVKYLRPLIEGECCVRYKDGLPVHFCF